MVFLSSIFIQVNLNVKEKHLTTMKPFLELILKKETRYPICPLCYRGWKRSISKGATISASVQYNNVYRTFYLYHYIISLPLQNFIILSVCWQLIAGFVHLPWRFNFPGNGNKKGLQQSLKQKDLHVVFSIKISYAAKMESITAMQKCKKIDI